MVSLLCFRPAQLLEFQILDQMKESVVAKLASSCEDLYSDCLKQFQRENLKNLFEREWISIVGSIYILQLHHSDVCK